jgi:hypothetical protein
MNKRTIQSVVLIFFGFCVVGSAIAGMFMKDEIPGERFRKAIDQIRKELYEPRVRSRESL